jgi:hypothetical protein
VIIGIRRNEINKMNKQMTIRQSVISGIVITIATLISMQVVHGEKGFESEEQKYKIDGKEVPEGCIEGYSDDYYDNHAEVTINKQVKIHLPPAPNGLRFNFTPHIDCEWREYTDFFMTNGYTVTSEFEDTIFLKGPPIEGFEIK